MQKQLNHKFTLQAPIKCEKECLQMRMKNKLFSVFIITYIQDNLKPNGVIANFELLKIPIKIYMLFKRG